MEEKRRFVRLPATVKVDYKILEYYNGKDVSLSKDISGGGIRLQVKEKLEEGILLQLELNIPTHPTTIIAIGKVVWVEKIKEEKGYDLGVEFTEISVLDRDVILQYIYYSRDKLRKES